jgi:hypothetical protein
MPTLSTPASPTPYVDDGEELMLVLRDFLTASVNFQKNPNVRPNDILALEAIERNADSALRLLKHLPVSREAVFEYFTFVIDLLAAQELTTGNTAPKSLLSSVEKLHKTLIEIIKNPKIGSAWAPIIVHWALDLLGDLSSKQGRATKGQLNEDLGK